MKVVMIDEERLGELFVSTLQDIKTTQCGATADDQDATVRYRLVHYKLHLLLERIKEERL